MGRKSHEEMSQQILNLIGGKENVNVFTHCVTRLRFAVKDKSLVKDVDIDKVNGVMGTQWLGDQYQIIVGNDVDDIYEAFCKVGGFNIEKSIDENLDGDLAAKEKFSLKMIGNKILAYTSPTMTGIIPIMMGACMCKVFATLLGPSLLNIISDTSDLYIVLNFMYSAFFYFIPLFLGYSAAKALNINPIYGIYLGALIMAPDFMNLIEIRESISIFGISAPVMNYSSSFLPVILGVWIMSFIYKFLNKHLPPVLKPIFLPLITILVMTPIMFVVCAPLGTYVGTIIGNFFISMSQSNIAIRIIGAILLSILMPYLVLGGMHGALLSFAIMTFTEVGYETFLLPIMTAYNFAVFGVAFGAMLKLKKPANKAAVSGCFVTGILGSVTEPCLYGVVVKYKGCMKSLLIGSVAFGLILGIFTPIYYAMSSATIFTFWIPWVGGTTANLISGIALIFIAFIGSAIPAYLNTYNEIE